MEKKIRYTLGKEERLKSRKAIEELFASGKSFSLFPFKIIYQKNLAGEEQITNNKLQTTNHKPQTCLSGRQATNYKPLQTAFSVSKKYFKKATGRNRVKRLMREAYRLQKNDLQNCLRQSNKSLLIFIIYLGNELPDYDLIYTKMESVLKRLKKIIIENPAN